VPIIISSFRNRYHDIGWLVEIFLQQLRKIVKNFIQEEVCGRYLDRMCHKCEPHTTLFLK